MCYAFLSFTLHIASPASPANIQASQYVIGKELPSTVANDCAAIRRPQSPHLHVTDMRLRVRDLAHLYHYYLHGERGSRAPAASPRAADAPPTPRSLPAISVRYVANGRELWGVDLADVKDDMESRFLQARAA